VGGRALVGEGGAEGCGGQDGEWRKWQGRGEGGGMRRLWGVGQGRIGMSRVRGAGEEGERQEVGKEEVGGGGRPATERMSEERRGEGSKNETGETGEKLGGKQRGKGDVGREDGMGGCQFVGKRETGGAGEGRRGRATEKEKEKGEAGRGKWRMIDWERMPWNFVGGKLPEGGGGERVEEGKEGEGRWE